MNEMTQANATAQTAFGWRKGFALGAWTGLDAGTGIGLGAGGAGLDARSCT